MKCSFCNLSFFSHRFNKEELDAIYAQYRGEHFYKVRHKWEPWYNASVNDAFSDNRLDDRQILIRREFTDQVLVDAGIDRASIRGVIDFGGDQGQFFPTNAMPPFFVVETGSEDKGLGRSVSFFERIADVPECVDLVMNCYVLEHLSSMGDVVDEMSSKLTMGGYLYFEVPLDSFGTSSFHRTKVYRKLLFFIAKYRLPFVLLDFLSGVYRHFFGRIPWFGIVKQSEHINYFDKDSLASFVSMQNAEVLYMSPEDRSYKVGTVRQGRLACVSRPR